MEAPNATTTKPNTKPNTAPQAEAPQAEELDELDALLAEADELEADGGRTPNTARLYTSGRISIADGTDGLAEGLGLTARIAGNTLILYADEHAKRKTNRKTDSTELLYNLIAVLRNTTAYRQAVENSKQDGSKQFMDYTITHHTTTKTKRNYWTIELDEHAPQAEAEAEAEAEADELEADGTADE